ncbi:Hpt domain-containing protein [Roseibium sp.]|uniref:Hpt domain-containing protein n=1 Tax=Roseibium sp. TaxID=1936156 RepID=UPI003B51E382
MTSMPQDQDYEIVSPPTDLRKKVRELSPREARKFDPVKAAEAALERIAPHFGNWMDNEAKGLVSAWDIVKSDGVSKESVDTLYQSVHNIKGQGLTLGFPLVGDVAASFCHLIENLPAPEDLPVGLAEGFVEAIRAMVTEGAKDTANKTGVELLDTLRTATDTYLAQFPPKDRDGEA